MDAARVVGHRGPRVLELVHLRPGQLAATFATRTAMRWVPGSAAGAIHRRLRRAGLDLVAPARSFHVVGIEGPLVAGELDRARAWGDRLGASLTIRAKGAVVTAPVLADRQ
jgi:hypothetical protein